MKKAAGSGYTNRKIKVTATQTEVADGQVVNEVTDTEECNIDASSSWPGMLSIACTGDNPTNNNKIVRSLAQNPYAIATSIYHMFIDYCAEVSAGSMIGMMPRGNPIYHAAISSDAVNISDDTIAHLDYMLSEIGFSKISIEKIPGSSGNKSDEVGHLSIRAVLNLKNTFSLIPITP